MITIKCETQAKAKLSEMIPFQGDLKKRSEQDFTDMQQSLVADGLLAPFFLWPHNDLLYILDGHHRRNTLVRMALKDMDILSQEFPAVMVEASSEIEARKALLQMSSRYGHLVKKELATFTAQLLDYKAPVIPKVHTPRASRKLAAVEDGYVLVQVKVQKSIHDKFLNIVRGVDGVSVI